MAYANSIDVRVYPTAWRGANAATEKTFNPEASLNTEENLSNLSNRLAKLSGATRLDSYVVSYSSATNKAVFVIHGYIFEVANLNNLGTPLWAKIQLLSAPTTYKGREFVNPTLACFDTGASGDEPAVAVLDMKDGAGTTDSDYYFHGVQFSNTEVSGDAANGVYVLQILDTSGNVPAKSWLVLETSQIKDTGSGNPLTETLTTDTVYTGELNAASRIYAPAIDYVGYIANSGSMTIYAGGALSIYADADSMLMSTGKSMNLFASSSVSLSAGKRMSLYASDAMYLTASKNLWISATQSVQVSAGSNITASASNIYAYTYSANPIIQLNASSGTSGRFQVNAGSTISLYAGNSMNFYINNKLIKVPSGASATLARVYDNTYQNKDRVYEAYRLIDNGGGTLTNVGNASKPVYFSSGRPTETKHTVQCGYGWARSPLRWFIQKCERNNSPDNCPYDDSSWKNVSTTDTLHYTYTRVGKVLDIHLETEDFDPGENNWIRIDLVLLLNLLKTNGNYNAADWGDTSEARSVSGWNSNPLTATTIDRDQVNFCSAVVSNKSWDLSSGTSVWVAMVEIWRELYPREFDTDHLSLFVGKETNGSYNYGWSCDVHIILKDE